MIRSNDRISSIALILLHKASYDRKRELLVFVLFITASPAGYFLALHQHKNILQLLSFMPALLQACDAFRLTYLTGGWYKIKLNMYIADILVGTHT